MWSTNDLSTCPCTPPTSARLAVLISLALAWSAGHALAQTQAATPAQPAASAAKPRIARAADLPRFSYPVTGKLEILVRSASPTDSGFAALAVALRRDTEAVLAGYQIADKAAERDLLGLLMQLDFLDGRFDQSLARAEAIRALQGKPADQLLSGPRLRAMATAAKTHAPGGEAYRQAVAGYI